MTDFLDWPTEYPTYQSLPIIDIYNSSEEFSRSIQREGKYTRVGRGTLLEIPQARGTWRNSLSKLFSSKEEYWPFLQVFNASRGRLASFFWVGEEYDYTVVAVSSSRLDVLATGNLSEWFYRPYVGIIQKDGTPVVREIDSVNRNGNVDEITLVDTWAISLSDIARCGLARKVRFEKDTLEEEWRTNQVVQINCMLQEVQEEKAIDLGIAQRSSGNTGPEQSDPPVSSLTIGLIHPTWSAESIYTNPTSQIYFSNDQRTAYSLGATTRTGYIRAAQVTGKHTMEFEVVNVVSLDLVYITVGLSSPSGYRPGSSRRIGNTGIHIPSLDLNANNGDIITVTVDCDADLVNWYRNGVFVTTDTLTKNAVDAYIFYVSGQNDWAIKMNAGQDGLKHPITGYTDWSYLSAGGELGADVYTGMMSCYRAASSEYCFVQADLDDTLMGTYISGSNVYSDAFTIEYKHVMSHIREPIAGTPQRRGEGVEEGSGYPILAFSNPTPADPATMKMRYSVGAGGDYYLDSLNYNHLNLLGHTLHHTLVYEKDAKAKHYINGLKVAESTINMPAFRWRYTSQPALLRLHFGRQRYEGFGDVRIYNFALTEEQIRDGLPGLSPAVTPTHWYKLDENYDTDVAVDSANGFNGSYLLWDKVSGAHGNIQKYSAQYGDPEPWY